MHILLYLPCNNICPCPPHFRSHMESSFLWSTPHLGSAEESDTHLPGMRSADKTLPAHLQSAKITIFHSFVKMVLLPINFLRFMFLGSLFRPRHCTNLFLSLRCLPCFFPLARLCDILKRIFHRPLHNSCAQMRVRKMKFQRNVSVDYGHVVSIGKRKCASYCGLFTNIWRRMTSVQKCTCRRL